MWAEWEAAARTEKEADSPVLLCISVSCTREGCSCQRGMEREVTECGSATEISVSSASTEETGIFAQLVQKELFRGFYLPLGRREEYKTTETV